MWVPARELRQCRADVCYIPNDSHGADHSGFPVVRTSFSFAAIATQHPHGLLANRRTHHSADNGTNPSEHAADNGTSPSEHAADNRTSPSEHAEYAADCNAQPPVGVDPRGLQRELLGEVLFHRPGLHLSRPQHDGEHGLYPSGGSGTAGARWHRLLRPARGEKKQLRALPLRQRKRVEVLGSSWPAVV